MTGNCTATVEAPKVRGKYGDPVEMDGYDFFTGEIPGCSAAPGPSPEIAERARDGVVVDVTLYVPEEPMIDRRSTVVLDGPCAGSYRIVDGPNVWQSGFSAWQPGTVVGLQRAEG